MLDPIRCGHLHQALADLLEVHRLSPQEQGDAAEDLLCRFGVTWRDLLVHEVNPADPLPRRQADVLANTVFGCRQHAEPGWLAVVAFLHQWAVRGSPRAVEDMKPFANVMAAHEEAQLEALRVAMEIGDTAQANTITRRMAPFLDEPLPPVQDVLGETLISSAAEGAR